MRRVLLLLALLAVAPVFAGVDDFRFDTGTIAATNSYSETKADPKSGCVKQIDVSLGSNTGAVSVSVFTVSTNGTEVSKSLLAIPTTTVSGSYPVRQAPVTSAGAALTNETYVPFYLSEDKVRIVVSNLNAAISTRVKVTVIAEEE